MRHASFFIDFMIYRGTEEEGFEPSIPLQV
jgi:hypothetical protein